ncbi:DUF6492 family protein [Roseomonas sp. CECT 9278]|uniref:DUF6492 family protein n=1 Tax=Roseomonas sp. CECT 9278 TaxID=2845823 RepID=UPI001EF9BFFB|nr:DUF6492 family protein [Roseomonas sp. CECT 9278]CAH0138188.1 hypothetical protein ROS9278_00409 [Roseomonas sp. CECT 9278]
MTDPIPVLGPARPLHLLTITHTPELAALRLQARSVARFLDPSHAGAIVVICNEPAMAPFRDQFDAQVRPEYGAHARSVTLMHRDELAQPRHWRHGWRSQQLLKLLASRHLAEGDVLVLDSKNHFIRPIAADSYRAPDGRLRTWRSHHRGHMEQYFRASVAAFDVPVEPHIDHWTPTVTPMAFPVADIRECLDALYVRFGAEFHETFLASDCRMTEFFLIAACQLRSQGDLGARYVFGDRPNSAILFKDKVLDHNRFGSVLFAASQPHTLSFAIHHAAVGLLNEAQRDRVTDFWVDRGLIAQREEAEVFLRPPYGA